VLLTALQVQSTIRDDLPVFLSSLCANYILWLLFDIWICQCVFITQFRISFFTTCNISYKTDIPTEIITKRAVLLILNYVWSFWVYTSLWSKCFIYVFDLLQFLAVFSFPHPLCTHPTMGIYAVEISLCHFLAYYLTFRKYFENALSPPLNY